MKLFTQGHTVSKWQNCDLSPGLSDSREHNQLELGSTVYKRKIPDKNGLNKIEAYFSLI